MRDLYTLFTKLPLKLGGGFWIGGISQADVNSYLFTICANAGEGAPADMCKENKECQVGTITVFTDERVLSIVFGAEFEPDIVHTACSSGNTYPILLDAINRTNISGDLMPKFAIALMKEGGVETPIVTSTWAFPVPPTLKDSDLIQIIHFSLGRFMLESCEWMQEILEEIAITQVH